MHKIFRNFDNNNDPSLSTHILQYYYMAGEYVPNFDIWFTVDSLLPDPYAAILFGLIACQMFALNHHHIAY